MTWNWRPRASGLAEDPESVRRLFDAKARSWASKYRADGPLQRRLEAFGGALTSLVPPPARVLDLGCGAGNLAADLAHRGYVVTGVDISEAMISEARRTHEGQDLDWVVIQARKPLPFDCGSFDAVVASSVFEYLDDVASTLGEVARILRPGGILLYTVPLPSHPTRRLEHVLAYLARLPLLRPADRVPRLGGYLQYLRLSRNRMSIARWESLGEAMGLPPVTAPSRALETLALLGCRRREK